MFKFWVSASVRVVLPVLALIATAACGPGGGADISAGEAAVESVSWTHVLATATNAEAFLLVGATDRGPVAIEVSEDGSQSEPLDLPLDPESPIAASEQGNTASWVLGGISCENPTSHRCTGGEDVVLRLEFNAPQPLTVVATGLASGADFTDFIGVTTTEAILATNDNGHTTLLAVALESGRDREFSWAPAEYDAAQVRAQAAQIASRGDDRVVDIPRTRYCLSAETLWALTSDAVGLDQGSGGGTEVVTLSVADGSQLDVGRLPDDTRDLSILSCTDGSITAQGIVDSHLRTLSVAAGKLDAPQRKTYDLPIGDRLVVSTTDGSGQGFAALVAPAEVERSRVENDGATLPSLQPGEVVYVGRDGSTTPVAAEVPQHARIQLSADADRVLIARDGLADVRRIDR